MGQSVAEIRYKPWGTTRYVSGTTPTSFQFTGQRLESSIGLLYYGARYYDPSLGRFIQADTIVPGGVQGLDRYAYVGNNPLKYTDPSGHGRESTDCGPDGDNCDPYRRGPNGRPYLKYLYPEYINQNGLTSGGKLEYATYISLFWDKNGWWWKDPLLGGDGTFTIEDYTVLVLMEELGQSYQNSNYVDLWTEGMTRNFYTKGLDPNDPAGLLNYINAYTGGIRTKPSNFTQPIYTALSIPIARNLLNIIIDPIGTGHREWMNGCVGNSPCHFGSHTPGSIYQLPYIEAFVNNNCSPSFKVFGTCSLDESFRVCAFHVRCKSLGKLFTIRIKIMNNQRGNIMRTKFILIVFSIFLMSPAQITKQAEY